MHEHTVATLTRTLAETIGEIETLRERIEDRTVLVESTQRLILHYNPEADVRAIRAIKVRGKGDLPRGAVTNAVIRVMKTGPLKTEDIVQRVAVAQGAVIGSDEHKAWDARVKAWLNNRKSQKKVVVIVDEAGAKVWALAPQKPP